MADALYSRTAPSRNADCGSHLVATLSTPSPSNAPASSALPDGFDASGGPARGDAAPDVRAILLAAAGTADVVRLGDLVDAVPDHPQPLSAVLALVDQGLLGIDLEAPFDPDLGLWRLRP
ncbi:MAG TPA: hypothetical protein VHL09_06215 [Dehalococcoidia bacterium]|nr:hypothetical protein [Dehalococcoidia bacterium]